MIKAIKNRSLFIYFVFSIFNLEILLKLSTGQPLTINDLFFPLLFSIPFSVLLFAISALLNRKDKLIPAFLLLLFTGLVFGSQFVYFQFFRTFYTLYSAIKGGQVTEFWWDILLVISRNWFWIVLFLIPSFLILVLRNKALFCKKLGFRSVLFLVLIFILSNALAVGAMYTGNRRPNTPYDLYRNVGSPLNTVQRLGLLTDLRLDAQRLIFGDNFSFLAWLPNHRGNGTTGNNGNSIEAYKPTPNEPSTPEHPSETLPGEKPEELPKEPNILDIDFDNLTKNDNNEEIIDMNNYFSSVPPTYKNEYTGKYEGYNLILLTAESFSPYAVHPDITPTLYKMINEGYNFTNFYNPIWEVSTLDGEYVACSGLLPKRGVWSLYISADNYMPFFLGNQLNALGYKTMAYHNHTYDYYRRDLSHPNMGYDYKGIGNGLVISDLWPRSDLEMMEKTIPEYIDNQPFHTYYMTVSGHMQYNFIGNNMAMKNKDAVKSLPYTEAGKAYIATQIELDKAMEYLLNSLEDAGIADKTLIALSADHYPYALEDEEIDDLAGHQVEKNFEL
ncbi:MAG: sulfatase-like hydrolase/transferase, partial [Clostridiales bacterium]|nr:sulfatase-like hydrolase/transferase [Clostridiales bacterium]